MKRRGEAPAAPSPKRVLDFEDLEDLEALITRYAQQEQPLTGFKGEFMQSMADRYVKFGERIRLSEKQWDVLKSIAPTFGMEFQE